jgi:hypothetical protein
MKVVPTFSFSAIAFAMALTPCFAQPQATATARVVITHVKPELANEWVDLQKNEVIPALKKAGVPTRIVYQTSMFGNSYEYATLTPFAKYADFDGTNPITKALGEAGSARLLQKVRRCVESTNSYSVTRLMDLSNVLEPATPVIITARYRVANGKMDEFQSLVKSEILPVYKKAKVSLLVNRRGYGANPNDVTLVTGYQKFADMDGGTLLQQKLGVEGAAKVNAKFTGVRTLIEVVVRRLVPELSF